VSSTSPVDDLVGITTWLDTSRCLTATVLVVITSVLRMTLLPELPIWSLVGLAIVEILLTVPVPALDREPALARRAHLHAVRRRRVLLHARPHLAPDLPNEFHFLYLLMIVPCALFSLLCGLVMATLATLAHLWLSPTIDWSMPVVIPIVVFFLVAQQSRFYGDRLVAKSGEAEGSARLSEALLTVARALANTTTSGGSVLQHVTELARGSPAARGRAPSCATRENGKFRVMGLASRTGTLDEEIKSVEFARPPSTVCSRAPDGPLLRRPLARASPISRD
jgi:hypothetical protein